MNDATMAITELLSILGQFLPPDAVREIETLLPMTPSDTYISPFSATR